MVPGKNGPKFKVYRDNSGRTACKVDVEVIIDDKNENLTFREVNFILM
jgi:hypothetical protein